MPDKIVVGTDGSATAKRAVAQAVRIAKAIDAEVHVVSAFKPLRNVRLAGAPAGVSQAYNVQPDEVARTRIEEAESDVKLAGVKVESHLIQADPDDALLRVAREIDAYMIIVGNRGMAGAKRWLGSVPNKVSHDARCNVMIVSTTED